MKYYRFIIFLMAAIHFTNVMDFMIIMPLNQLLVNYFHCSQFEFSAMVASYGLSSGITGFLASSRINRYNRRSALLFVYVGFIIGTIACALAPSMITLTLARAFCGVFGGLLGTLIISSVSDLAPFEKRGMAIGIVMTAFGVASAIAIPSGLFIAIHFGWRATFIAIAALSSIILLFCFYFIPSMTDHLEDHDKNETPLTILKRLITDPNQRNAIYFTFFLVAGQFTVIPSLNSYLEYNVGFERTELPLMYFFGGILLLIFSPLFGKWSDIIGKPKMFYILAILSLIPLYLVTNMPTMDVHYGLIITTFFFLFIGGRMGPAITMITSVVSIKERAGFISIRTAAQQVCSGSAAMIAGMIIYQETPTSPLENYNIVGYVAICSSLLALYTGSKLKMVG